MSLPGESMTRSRKSVVSLSGFETKKKRRPLLQTVPGLAAASAQRPALRDRRLERVPVLRDLRLGEVRERRTPWSGPSRVNWNSGSFTSAAGDLGQVQRDAKVRARAVDFRSGLA